MKKLEHKVPNLRFKDFTDDWEQRKLGEISTSFSGGTPSVKNKSYYGGKIPFIRSAEIHKDKTELFITENGLKNSSAKLIKKGTLLYALYGATSGEVDVSNIDGAINQAIMAIFLQKDNVSFIKYYLEKNKYKIIAKYLQGGQGNLSASIIKSVHINLPFTEEQLKISNLIKKVESLISLQQQKLDLLKQLKKGLLQKMFADKDSKRPVLRFKGFHDDWEQHKLGEIITYYNGKSHEEQFRNAETQNFELVTLKSIDGNGNLCSSEKYIDSTNNTLSKNDLIMVLSEQNTGLVGMTTLIPRDNYYVLNQRVALLKLHKNNSPFFLTDAINQHQIFFERMSAGTKVQNISKSNVENFNLYIPNYSEQKEVGHIIALCQNIITLQQRKLDLLKQLKKGLLQKMFADKDSKRPVLRFKGFHDDWEQRKLGELIESLFQGINTAADKVEYSNNGLPIIQAKNITSGSLDFSGSRKLSVQKYSNYLDKYIPQKGDILFANIGTIGPNVILKDTRQFFIAWNILRIVPQKGTVPCQVDTLNNEN